LCLFHPTHETCLFELFDLPWTPTCWAILIWRGFKLLEVLWHFDTSLGQACLGSKWFLVSYIILSLHGELWNFIRKLLQNLIFQQLGMNYCRCHGWLWKIHVKLASLVDREHTFSKLQYLYMHKCVADLL